MITAFKVGKGNTGYLAVGLSNSIYVNSSSPRSNA